MKSLLLLLLLMVLSALMQSSEAVRCYECDMCERPTTATCRGEICTTAYVYSGSAFHI